jgi:hypothetical protein
LANFIPFFFADIPFFQEQFRPDAIAERQSLELRGSRQQGTAGELQILYFCEPPQDKSGLLTCN